MRTIAATLAVAAVVAGAAAAPASAHTPSGDPPPSVTLDPSQLVLDRARAFVLRPDLTIAELDLDRSRGRLTVSVTNQGLAPARASTTRVHVLIRNPVTYMARTVRIVDVPTGALKWRQTRTFTVDLDGVADRQYPISPFAEIRVTADVHGTVAESDEGNNAQGVLGRPQ
jgi:hypothetical protein